MQNNKTFYLFVKGQRVEVSEEIYRAYVQPERKQRMCEYRAKGDISVTSIEGLSEKGFEIEDETQDFVSALVKSSNFILFHLYKVVQVNLFGYRSAVLEVSPTV